MNKSRRVDIDFLRGIAVISVIIFHLDPDFFPRGYLGVDLFFVISGYLITQSILKSYKLNSFKFSEHCSATESNDRTVHGGPII